MGQTLLDRTIASAIAALPEAARRLLEVIAVAGRPMERSVARRAATVGSDKPAAIALLRAERLTRNRRDDEREELEIYHDRIREVLVARLAAPHRRQVHLQLGHALAADPAEDPGILAWHFHEGGCDDVASGHAVAAGDQAARALAFDAAARHYGLALEWHAGDEERSSQLTQRRAEALSHAGRGAQAGPLFLGLAAHAPRGRSLELRRLGVDQLLVSGIIDRGVDELRALLREVRLPFPRSDGAALFAVLWSLVLSWLRWTLAHRGRSIAPSLPSPDEARRADVAGSAFRGLLPVAPAQAGYFAVAELRLALGGSDRRRISTCLARVGSGVLGPGPSWLARIGARLLGQAARLADGDDDPILQGSLSIARGAFAFWDGEWSQALALGDRGIEILSTGPSHSAHERNLANVVAIRSLEELGRWPVARARAEEMHRDAVDRGDIYAEVTACLNHSFGRLALGDSSAARRWAEHGLARWSREGQTLQHVYALRAQLYCDLYDEQPARAWERLAAAWSDIRRAMHLTTRPGRVDLMLLRGRIAIACAEANPGARRRFLGEAIRCARSLAATGRADAICHSAQLRAGIAAVGDHTADSRRELEQAALGYRTLGMQVYAACAELRLRALDHATGDDRAAEALSACGIADPRRWTRIYAPGFGDAIGR